MLKEYLSKLDHINKIEIYSGALNEKQKKDALDNIRQPNDSDKNTDVLIIQLKSGGVGLNLQEFDRIIFTGPWWTQAIIEQGIGRAVRIGQTQQVVVHHLLLRCEETMIDKTMVMNIDKKMNEKAKEKYALNNYYLALADSSIQT
jgi:SNF2 family DNA or RNA helicase